MQKIEVTGKMMWHWPAGADHIVIVVRKDGEHYDNLGQGIVLSDILDPILNEKEGPPGVRVKLTIEKFPE